MLFGFFRKKNKDKEQSQHTDSDVAQTPSPADDADRLPEAIPAQSDAPTSDTADTSAASPTPLADTPTPLPSTATEETADCPIDNTNHLDPIDNLAEQHGIDNSSEDTKTDDTVAPRPDTDVPHQSQSTPHATHTDNNLTDVLQSQTIAMTAVAVQEDTTQSPTPAESATATLTAPHLSATTETPETPKLGWAARLKQGLAKSRDHMAKSLASVFGGGKIDEDLYEELETVLLTADTGIEATEKLLQNVRDRVSLKGLKDGAELKDALKEALFELIAPLEAPLVLPPKASGSPFVIMLAGINGAGKTTSIGKLAKYFQAQGHSVLLAAGDTFRAAAREQLQEWGKRNDVTVISQASGDSAAVCFDAVEAAKARGIDIVLADTAGRLPAQLHLMEEIKKVKRVLQKAMPDAPHEIILVLDANIGQNALRQVAAFDETLGLTGLILTKLDGTAKGGILAALAHKHPVPVRYIGVGEGIDDLRPFKAREFVDALLDD